MVPVLSLLLLALAVSLDGFGVGVMYGLRKIRIPLLSTIIIAGCSGLVVYAAMMLGAWLSGIVPPDTAKDIGAVILMGIGCWSLYQWVQQHRSESQTASQEAEQTAALAKHEAEAAGASATEVFILELKRFGLVIQILRTPSIADIDRSGNISAYEATFLGLALSLDAFGAGFGAAMLGFTPWLTASAVLAASGIFLSAGLHIGFKFAELEWVRRLSILPGFVLIFMGIMKLM